MGSATNNAGDIKNFIDSIDLEKVIEHLQSFEKWKRKDAVSASTQYKNYLYLLLKHPLEDIPPSYLIQKVWETHILLCQNNYIELKKQLTKNSHRLNYKEYFHQKKFIKSSMRNAYEKITKNLYKNEFQETLSSYSCVNHWDKYQPIILRWSKSLSFYLILAIFTAFITFITIRR